MSHCRFQIVLDDMSSKQIGFPKGSPIPSTKNVIFRQSRTFFLDILFIDPDDSEDQGTVRSSYMIGPFQSPEGPIEVNVEVKLMGFWLSCVIDSARMGDTVIPVVKYRALTSSKKIAKLASILDEETKRRVEMEKTLQEERIEQQNLKESKATVELQHAECKTLLETNTKQHEELQTVLEDSLKSAQDSLDWARSELQMLHEELQIETEKKVNASKFGEQILLSDVHIAVVEHRLAESETLLESTRKQHEEHQTTIRNEVQKAEKLKNSLDAQTNRMIEVEESREKDSKAALELQLVVLQTERDNAVKERVIAFKRVEELYQRKPAEPSGHVVNFTEFSHSELNKATNNFNNSLKIGEGGYGSVYKGFLRFTTVAIKVLKPESKQGDTEFNKEVEILNKTRHPNLVSLIGASPEAQALIYEFIPNGSLNTFLTNGKNSSQNLSWRDRIRIASEICSALIFLHSVQPHGIVHGDLQPENILLDSNLVSKISDFGVSQVAEVQKLRSTLQTTHEAQ